MENDNHLLWENDNYIIQTPNNPHIPHDEGIHLIVLPKSEYKDAWEDPDTSAEAFKLASQVCKIAQELSLSDWFNIQANGNWGLLPGGHPYFHIHIYGRNKTKNWGTPITLPQTPNSFHNQPLPEADREKLQNALKQLD